MPRPATCLTCSFSAIYKLKAIHIPVQPLLDAEGPINAPGSVTVEAGAAQSIEVTFTAPKVDSDSGVLWSGKVVLEGDNCEFITVPYMGEASTYNWTPLEGVTPAFRYDSDSGYLYPFSPDLVHEGWTVTDFSYPLVAGAGSQQWRGPLRTQPDAFSSYTEFPIEFPLRFSNVGFNTFPSFSNDTEISSGRYRILSRALRMFENPSNEEDWQLYLSDLFGIQHGNDPIPGSNTTTTQSLSSSRSTPTTTSSTQESSNAITATSPVSTPTSVPGITTTLRAMATPTGIPNGFVDISLRRQGVSSQDIYDPNSWMELHVQIKIPTRLKAGSFVSFALPPDIVDVAEKAYVMDTASNLVGSARFDQNTGLYSIAFDEWAKWHSDIVRDFYLYCGFSEEVQSSIQAGTYFVEIRTVGYSSHTLSYDRYARSSPDGFFTGVVDRTGPIQGGETTTSSSPISTTTTFSTSHAMGNLTNQFYYAVGDSIAHLFKQLVDHATLADNNWPSFEHAHSPTHWEHTSVHGIFTHSSFESANVILLSVILFNSFVCKYLLPWNAGYHLNKGSANFNFWPFLITSKPGSATEVHTVTVETTVCSASNKLSTIAADQTPSSIMGTSHTAVPSSKPGTHQASQNEDISKAMTELTARKRPRQLETERLR
ncbi:hypothetical protein B0T10DRAFT_465165 [Thelonectria olida]|uniref:Uncharacterized protein n=1 Tax=Thelonectria olida TaxID=1576542 RepID=A0A9P8VUJ0_9HYPO|nr:hypothetical protein B0T10DRAFT_465165 [Thelonectria olida]